MLRVTGIQRFCVPWRKEIDVEGDVGERKYSADAGAEGSLNL